MKPLVFGDRVIPGRHVVEAECAAGHGAMTFERGRSRPDVDGLAALHGDREGDPGALAGRRFGAAIDRSTPTLEREAARIAMFASASTEATP